MKKKVPVTEFFRNLQKTNQIFSCTTLRKRDKKVDGEIVERAGTPFTSTYRFNVPATIKEAQTRLDPGVRVAEDAAKGLVTAYDVSKLDEHGERGAFRRINLLGVQMIKALGKEYVVVDENGELFVEEKEN